MNAAIAALLGALIGAAASIVTSIIHQKYQNKRELLRIASDLAREDYKRRFEIVTKEGGEMPPISVFVHYHVQVLEHMAKGTYTPETISRLREENAQVLSAYKELGARQVEAGRDVT